MNGCSKCAGNYIPTTEEFIEKANKIHNNKYDYSKVNYSNNRTKIEIICKIHGSFLQTPSSHLENKKCLKCNGNYISNTEEWIEKANKIHSDRYDYSKVKYKTSRIKIEIICKKHNSFLQTPSGHLQGYGCPMCGYNILNTEEWIEKAIKIHGDRYDYSKVAYNTCRTKIEIICKVHGIFLQSPNNHLSGYGCLKCTSRGFSQKSITWLECIMKKENIYIEHALNDGEYKIPDTRFRADGFCKETNTVYEFHGTEYHGDPRLCNPEDCNYLGNNYKDLYDKTIERYNQIKELGYHLIVMWEYDWDNSLKKIIDNIITSIRFLFI